MGVDHGSCSCSGEEGELELDWPAVGGDTAKEILRDGRARTSRACGDHQRRVYHHTNLKYQLEFLGRGEWTEMRTPCKLAKTMAKPSHKPGEAGNRSNRFPENKILSARASGDNNGAASETAGDTRRPNFGDCRCCKAVQTFLEYRPNLVPNLCKDLRPGVRGRGAAGCGEIVTRRMVQGAGGEREYGERISEGKSIS